MFYITNFNFIKVLNLTVNNNNFFIIINIFFYIKLKVIFNKEFIKAYFNTKYNKSLISKNFLK